MKTERRTRTREKRSEVRKRGIPVRGLRRTRRKTKRKSGTATLMSWKRRTQGRRREGALRSRWVMRLRFL